MAVNCDPPIGTQSGDAPLQLTPSPQRSPVIQKLRAKPKLPALTKPAAELVGPELPLPPKPKPVHHLQKNYQSSRMPEGTVVDIQGSAVIKPLVGKVHKLQVGEVLKKGDVILLERYRVDPLDVYVEGVQKLRALPGIYKGNTAIQIAGTIQGKEARYYGTE